METIVYTKTFPAPPIGHEEILRYAGAAEKDKEIIEACLSEVLPKLSYKVCYMELPALHTEDGVSLGAFALSGETAKKHLAGCHTAIVFAATIGIEMDRHIAKYGRLSPSKALFMQAIGAERIESLCDAFSKEMETEYAAKGAYTRPRFSPGYGDLPLSVQGDIFAVLSPHRKIGLSLNESLLMSPTKSVTAFIGVSKTACAGEEEHNCIICGKKDCAYRRDV